MVPEPLQVDPERLAAAASLLLASAGEIPSAPAPQPVSGSDPLSQAIAAQAGKVEAPVTEGLPAVQKAATENVENVAKAAKAYEQTDQRLGDDINRRTFPVDNTTTTTPTTPSTAPMPECDLDEIAKLHRKVDDLDRREANLRTEIEAFNKLPHDFDMTNPAAVKAAAEYETKRAALVKRRDALAHEEMDLRRELTECGIKMYSKNGQEIIEWPDGSTTPTPTPSTPAPNTPTPTPSARPR
ncbi:type VII secretion target [Mycobacterium celatum]|uniref:Uncharacterized protein n=1 Tax=Mycobacterium celatum TaxID=28045 RepID=A0A1X1RMQ6_MYCCE|nr:type VII secretion target [Mycobacterium celatum]ORV09832.1 hypothetical protein AWB95_16495 [Mycobacterium celatum]